MGAQIRSAIIVGLLGLAWVPTAARADEQQDQAACMTDAQMYCSQFFPIREEVAHCLQRNRPRISEACRTVLANFKEDQPAGQEKTPPQNISPVKKKPPEKKAIQKKPPLKKPAQKKPALKKPPQQAKTQPPQAKPPAQ